MESKSSSEGRRNGSGKSSRSDGLFSSFFSRFACHSDSSTERVSSKPLVITHHRSFESVTAPSSDGSDVDGNLLSVTTSFTSVPTPALRKQSRSSSSSSSVFSKLYRQFSGSPPRQLSGSHQRQSQDLILRPSRPTLFGRELTRKSSRVLDNAENSPFRSQSDIRPAMDQLRIRPGTLLRPGSLLADQREKARRRKDAQDLYQTIVRNAERSKTTVPPYEFLELIGKGAFGRVYKCRDKRTGDLVAVKIADIDENDFSSSWAEQNTSIRDFHKEVSILQQLKDSKVKNVNIIHDAFDLHSQLWIVADYCTGGSVRTLLYPTAPNGLEEVFIVPIARELAVALQGVHDIDVIHRDVKCANVYITESGDIQLGDFGIVGLIEDGNSKRKTVIGTPHFMPIEMINGMNRGSDTEQAYGTEVDVWSYGITVYEMATGQPPNTRLQPHALARVLEENPPRLEGERYSEELRDFVAFCLQTDPKARPTMSEVLEHPYVANTSKKFPSSNLVKLVERFKIWEHGGGSRNSLWSAGGVVLPPFDETEEVSRTPEDDEGWNFSTSDDFDQEFGQRLSQMFEPGGAMNQDLELLVGAVSDPPKQGILSPAERIRQEHREKAANRGKEYLGKLFAGSEPYGMRGHQEQEPTPPAPPSDLPLRTYTDSGEEDVSCQVIDLDEANTRLSTTAPMLRLSLYGGEDTIRASSSNTYQDDDEGPQLPPEQDQDEKRNTMAWTFPASNAASENRDTMNWKFPNSDPTTEKRDTMAWKFPEPEPTTVKRATMAWTFDTAGPAEPEVTDSSMELPSAGEDGLLPPGYRPKLQHTATEPIGRFEKLMYDAPRSSSAASRLSTGTIDLDAADPIDLDAAIPSDPAEIPRPSTASSAAGSTMTDATSGNPFDLEEDPMQIEVDRNRFSYHKQWQSEGGRMKRSSYKSMQMHVRGNSLSSTDSELDLVGSKVRESFDGNLNNQSDASQQHNGSLQLGLGDGFSRTDWPDFGDFNEYSTADTLPHLRDLSYPSETALRTDGSMASLSGLHQVMDGIPGRPIIDMPDPEVPAPVALVEDADQQLLASEFSKQMSNLEGSLLGMMHALRTFAHLGDEDNDMFSPSNGDSGFDSTKETSEDEDGYDGDTIKRDRTRRLNSRTRSPQLPHSGQH